MVVGGRELIDTLWNVNTSAAEEPSGDAQEELIDTLWNVNLLPLTLVLCIPPELIDTLWNVNHIAMQ